jgi:hypothetical protein
MTDSSQVGIIFDLDIFDLGNVLGLSMMSYKVLSGSSASYCSIIRENVVC